MWNGTIPVKACRCPAPIAAMTGSVSFSKSSLGDSEILAFEPPRQFVAQDDNVAVIGWERARVKATNRTVEVNWVMAFTVRGEQDP